VGVFLYGEVGLGMSCPSLFLPVEFYTSEAVDEGGLIVHSLLQRICS
jgi:hypothetical protein